MIPTYFSIYNTNILFFKFNCIKRYFIYDEMLLFDRLNIILIQINHAGTLKTCTFNIICLKIRITFKNVSMLFWTLLHSSHLYKCDDLSLFKINNIHIPHHYNIIVVGIWCAKTNDFTSISIGNDYCIILYYTHLCNNHIRYNIYSNYVEFNL